jgi:hypothetical protein
MLPRLLVVLAITLGAACLWPLVLVFQWVGVNVATLERMGRTDPRGFDVFTAFVMFLQPTLAALAAVSALRAAVIAAISPPQRASRILLPAAAVQAGLVLVIAITTPPIHRTLARMVPLFEDRQTPGALIAPDFTMLQAAAAAAILPPLIAIALGCAVVALLSRRN